MARKEPCPIEQRFRWARTSTSRRPAIVLVLVLDFFLGVVIRSRAHCTNRSWCQKVGQMSRVFQVQTTGRFEVEDFAKHIWRFVAGSGTTWGLRPGGTPEYHRAINPQDIVLQSRYRLLCDSTHERPKRSLISPNSRGWRFQPWAKPISIVPPG